MFNFIVGAIVVFLAVELFVFVASVVILVLGAGALALIVLLGLRKLLSLV